MPESLPPIAVVGAAGLVGRELLAELERLGIRATAVIRGDPAISVDGDFHAVLTDARAYPAHRFTTVVNLAYPTTGLPFEQPDANAAIVDLVNHLVTDRGHLVHVSTQAVFGVAVDRPVHAARVDKVRDLPYVELKIAAEHAFEDLGRTRALALDVVRLGNVWGEASRWALPVVHRLLTGRPLLVRDAPGFSNTTDVANVASYLAFLARREAAGGTRYHHLAEFSDVTWQEWVAPVAVEMGITPLGFDSHEIVLAPQPTRELLATIAPVTPRPLYRRMAEERVLGSWTRTLIRAMPARAQQRLKSDDAVFAEGPGLTSQEATFLSILVGLQRFESVTDPGWSPPVSHDESLRRVLAWLRWDAL